MSRLRQAAAILAFVVLIALVIVVCNAMGVDQ